MKLATDFAGDEEVPVFTPEKEAELRELAADPGKMFLPLPPNPIDIYQKLIDSIAPNIWELEDIKKGLLCQLFGGETQSKSGGFFPILLPFAKIVF